MIIQDNILYVDIEKLVHKLIINNKKSKNIRILWGIIKENEFENTLETIKYISENEQIRLKNYVKSIFEEDY
mgnify:CR=1 FL=1